MNKVTVQVATLRAAVEANRANHRGIFEEAVTGYRAEQIRVMEADIARIKKGKMLDGVRYLPVPKDHTKDYDRVLRMLDMHVAATIEVSQEDFARYVMDDWAWRREFIGTSANYSERAKKIQDDAEDEP